MTGHSLIAPNGSLCKNLPVTKYTHPRTNTKMLLSRSAVNYTTPFTTRTNRHQTFCPTLHEQVAGDKAVWVLKPGVTNMGVSIDWLKVWFSSQVLLWNFSVFAYSFTTNYFFKKKHKTNSDDVGDDINP